MLMLYIIVYLKKRITATLFIIKELKVKFMIHFYKLINIMLYIEELNKFY